MCRLRLGLKLGIAAILLCSRIGVADEFETLEGPALKRFVAEHESQSIRALTTAEISAMPALLKDTRSPLLVIKTAEGNYGRLLLIPELHKSRNGKGSPFPILVLERFDVFDASNTRKRLSKGREIILFDGFQADLDTGQVVPDGEGGDLRFVAPKGSAPRLEAIGETRLFVPRSMPASESNARSQPTPGRRVVPADFAGRFRFFSNGQLSGLLDLRVDDRSSITGTFRSDAQGSVYELTGIAGPENPQRIRFTIKFPRSTQEFDGYLWADGKGAIAGSGTVLERSVGFFAVREGGRVAPLGVEVVDLDRSKEARLDRVSIGRDAIRVSGNTVPIAELGKVLKKLGRDQLVIEVAAGTPYERVDELLQLARECDFASIRLGLEPAKDQK